MTAADVDRILLATPGVVRLTIMKPRKRSRRSKRGQKNDVYEDDTPLIAVEYDPAMVGPRDIIEVLEAAPAVGAGKSNAPPTAGKPGGGGYTVEVPPVVGDGFGGMAERQLLEIQKWRRAFLFSIVFTVPVFLISMVFLKIPAIKMSLSYVVAGNLYVSSIILMVLASPVQFISGARFYIDMYKGLKAKSLGMSALIVVGTTAAYVYSAMTVILVGANVIQDNSGAHFFETSAMLIRSEAEEKRGG